MLVSVIVSNERREQRLSKAREKGPDALPITMIFLWLIREGNITSTVVNMIFRVLSSGCYVPGVPSSLYLARQLEEQLVPRLV